MLWGSLGPTGTLENEVIVAGACAPPAATTISGATADPEHSGVESATEDDFPGRTRSLYKDRVTPGLPNPLLDSTTGRIPDGFRPACVFVEDRDRAHAARGRYIVTPGS